MRYQVVACTDVGDQGVGAALLESASQALSKEPGPACNAAQLKCASEKLPDSGKTPMQRLGLPAPPPGHPLIFLTANGDPARALETVPFHTRAHEAALQFFCRLATGLILKPYISSRSDTRIF